MDIENEEEDKDGKDLYEMSFVQVAVLFEMGMREQGGGEAYTAGGLRKRLGLIGAVRGEEAMKQLLRRMVGGGLVQAEDGENEDGDPVKRYGVTKTGKDLGKELVGAMGQWGFGARMVSSAVSAPKMRHSKFDAVTARSLPAQGQSSRPVETDNEEEEEELSMVRKVARMVGNGGQPDPEEQALISRLNTLAAELKRKNRISEAGAMELALCQMERGEQ